MNDLIKVAWLYPDTLYLHGERGNILALEKIAREMGVAVSVTKIDLGDKFDPEDFDILYVSAGELSRLKSIRNELSPVRDDLLEFINSGRPMIVTGNSINFFGNNVKLKNGSLEPGLSLIDIDSVENEAVYGDDILLSTIYNGQAMTIVGNQIQMADVEVKDEKPFGELKYGYGNNGETVNEGVIKNNSIFTNTLGPLLVSNPWLTEEILKVACTNKKIYPNYPELKFDLEKKSLESKKNYIKNKKTNLTNVNLN